MRTNLRDRPNRILALDVRARRIGYVALQSHGQLIDFGVTRFTSRDVAQSRLLRILGRVQPAVLVLRKIRPRSSRNTVGMRKILRVAQLQADHSGIAMKMVREKEMSAYFGSKGVITKYQTALVLTKRFGELEWKLPPPRKAWKREHPNMSIFDAAALAVTYIAAMKL